MPSSLNRLIAAGDMRNYPKWLPDNIHYEVITGSHAYGINTSESDWDIYGFAIPPKHIVFPHLAGYIHEFDKINGFDQFQVTGIEHGNKEYDFTFYSIIRFFRLCLDNNPNMIDALFVPFDCILKITDVGGMVRDNRHLFLNKKLIRKFIGYARSQSKKMRNVTPASKRYWMMEKYKYDLKFASHLVRLMLELEQLVELGDLDLRRDKEMLKSIRRGDWSLTQVDDWFARAERRSESLLEKSPLSSAPRIDEVRALLLRCLEHHYGDMSAIVGNNDAAQSMICEIESVIGRYKNRYD